MSYQVKCDQSRHIVLLVEVGPKFTKYISKDKKTVDLRKMPNAEFARTYSFEYQDYPLEEYAARMLNLQKLGVIVTHRAKAHLTTFFKEPIMAKISAPVKDLAPQVEKPVKEPKAPKAEKVAKTPKVKAEGEEGGEKAPRNRREKLDTGLTIKVIGANPARVGTIRHSIVETIFAAKTVGEACDSTVTRKNDTEYKIGLPDIYFAVNNSLIELV